MTTLSAQLNGWQSAVLLNSPMGEVKNHLNQSVAVYLIGKRDSYVVVAQLSPEFTARLVDRWQELEQAQQLAIPQSFSEALRLAADLAEQKQKLATELAAAAPKVEFVDRYCSASGSMSFRQVAKLLKAKENEFRLFLIDRGILYRLAVRLHRWRRTLMRGDLRLRLGPLSLQTTHSARRGLRLRGCAGSAVYGRNILLRGRQREGFADT